MVKKTRFFEFIYLCLWGFLLSACGATIEPPEAVTLNGVGPDTLEPVTRRLADAFTRDTPHLSFELATANSNRAGLRVAGGEVDFAMMTIQRPDLTGLQAIPIARDGIAIIVHPDNPVDNLTLRDLQRLYTGQVFNWRAVEGSRGVDMPVQVVTREREAGTGLLFTERILGGQRMTPNARVFPNSVAVANFISQHPDTIGFVSQVHVSEKVKAVAVEEILLSAETVANAAYPLTYLVYLALPSEANPIIEEFVDFVLGPSGQSILTGAGFGRLN